MGIHIYAYINLPIKNSQNLGITEKDTAHRGY